jgi:hypothetical protein
MMTTYLHGNDTQLRSSVAAQLAAMSDPDLVHSIHMLQTQQEESVLVRARELGITLEPRDIVGTGVETLLFEANRRKLDY